MKRFILTIFCLLFVSSLYAGPLQQMHKKVIAQKRVESGVASGFVGFYSATSDSSGTATGGSNRNAYLPSVQATTSGIVRYIHVMSTSTLTSVNCNAALYSSDGLSLLIDGAYGNPTANGSSWYTIMLDSDYNVSDAVSYRIAWGNDDVNPKNFERTTTGGSGTSFREVPGTVAETMPATMTGGISVNFSRFIMYADNNAGIVAP